MTAAAPLPFKISVLLFMKDEAGRFLLIKRRKAPNLGCWSPPGGKLETSEGESPFQCAVREAHEETGHATTAADWHLFGMVSERGYEGAAHWLMFLFECKKPIVALPPEIDEGRFHFFARDEIAGIPVPDTDRELLWPYYDKYREGFVAYRAECHPGRTLALTVEESSLSPNL